MKTKIIYILALFFATTVTNSFAQVIVHDNDISGTIKNSDKNIDFATNSGTKSSINIEEKVSKAFASSFASAEKVKWYEKSRKDLVKFVMNDQEHIALFNKNGSIFYHISYGYEKNLPIEVKQLVTAEYPDYNITKVISITQNGRNFWVLNMESQQYFKILNVEDGNIKEMNHFRVAGIAL